MNATAKVSLGSATGCTSAEFNPLLSITDNAMAQPGRTATAVQVVELLRTGKHRPLVARIRAAFARVLAETGDPKAAKKAVDADKKQLPGIMFSGVFRARGDKNLETYSQVLCGDFDGLAAEHVGIAYDQLAGDPHCLLASVSPSGHGVKCLCPTTGNAEQHEQSVAAMAKYFRETYGLEIDPSCKNLERLCFAPDNASEWKGNAIPFEPLPMEVKTSGTRPLAPPMAAAHPSGRKAVAERLLGAIQWEDEIAGFCKCPGEHLHTTANSAKDCKVMLDGVPTIKCFHGSCAGIVAGVNHELRSQIGKAEVVVSSPAPISNRASIAREYLGSENEQVAASEKDRVFTIRTPDEILGMIFNDDDIILGDRMMAEGQSCVIAAAGGMGKSRIVLQILACITTVRKFLNFDTGKDNSTWLVLQTENSNRRLHDDLKRLKAWLGDDWSKFADRVKFHTVENDTDGFVNLDSPEAVANIESVIKRLAPDNIVIDPLNDFAVGDPNKDADMKMTVQALSRICRKGNPKRAILILHHAITGRAGAARATGFDRASFGRNSKALFAWTRAQINIAPVDADSNERLIFACGKCSNGREFQTFAVRLNPETMIYECDPTVDISQWEQEITGAKKKRTASPELVRELAHDKPTKAELVKRIRAEVGCGHSAAYDAVEIAERRKTIHYSKALKTYDQSA